MAFERQRVEHVGFDVEDVLPQLTMDEKVSLLSGADFWHTVSVPRLNIPAVRLSDGPNGIRGTKFFRGVPAACLPCGMLVILDQITADTSRNRIGCDMGHRAD